MCNGKMVERSKTLDSGSNLGNGARVRIPFLSIFFRLLEKDKDRVDGEIL